MVHDANGSGPVVRVEPKRVLVVDDDVALATGLKLAIENGGYVVRVVHEGLAALEAAISFQPDLVVLDVMMPVVDGWEVLSRLRVDDALSTVPVIMLTAADSEDAKVRGFELGADDYVTKPFNVQELRCRISAVLRRCSLDADRSCRIPVLASGGVTLVCCHDVFFISGVRNFTHVHTSDSRFLSQLTLGELERRGLDGFMRVHRSYIVNMEHVRGCGWVGKSSYRLRLADDHGTEVPVSRALIPDVRRELGVGS